MSHRNRTGLFTVCASVTALAMLAVPSAAFANDQGQYYSSKQPYVAPTAADITAYSDAPAGYTPIYTESVNRHGSRGLSSYKYDALLRLMANTAAEENGFVNDEVKNEFIKNLDAITAANVKNGYGMLTELGREEQQGIGQRAFERNQALFAEAEADGAKIAFQSSGEARATESGDNFKKGLVSASGDALAANVEANVKSPGTLYFHKLENPDGTVKQPGDVGYDEAKAYGSGWMPKSPTTGRSPSISTSSNPFRKANRCRMTC